MEMRLLHYFYGRSYCGFHKDFTQGVCIGGRYGRLIAMVKDAVVPLAGFMAVTAMLGVVIVMYKQTIMAVINTLLYR